MSEKNKICKLVSNNLLTVNAIGNGYSISIVSVLNSVNRAIVVINTAVLELTNAFPVVPKQKYPLRTGGCAGGIQLD